VLHLSLLRLNTRKIIRGRSTDPEEGKTTGFSIVTEPARSSERMSIQLPMPIIQEEMSASAVIPFILPACI